MLSRCSRRAALHGARRAVGPSGRVLAGGATVAVQARALNIHEYASMELMKGYGVPTPLGVVCETADAAQAAFEAGTLGSEVVVKAQVLAGGRGKGTFKNGFQGGVQMVSGAAEAKEVAGKMLGQVLVTKQTGEEGKICEKVYLMEKLSLKRETYFSILMDRAHGGPVLVGSPAGGMNIEEVAATTPELIFTEPVDIMTGVADEQVARMATNMGFEGESATQAAAIMKNLYEMFIASDGTLVEINPLAETASGDVFCCDAKLNFDDNAEFRQDKVFAYRDVSQEDAREVEAAKYGLNYIGLDGSIGCLVNGAGLAMATMDIVSLHSALPFPPPALAPRAMHLHVWCFLEMPCANSLSPFPNLQQTLQRAARPTSSTWAAAPLASRCRRPLRSSTLTPRSRPSSVRPTSSDSDSLGWVSCTVHCDSPLHYPTSALLSTYPTVNIFGGIMSCAIIAQGMVEAAQNVGIKKPLVVRVKGTAVEEAKEIIKASPFHMMMNDDLDEAASLAVKVSEIVVSAEAIPGIDVSFNYTA